MNTLRVLIKSLSLIFIYLCFAVAGTLLLVFLPWNPGLHRRSVLWFARRWAWISCVFLGIHMKVEGNLNIPSGSLIVANHVGSPDIFILGSCFPAFFVSKAEISGWPLVGWLARLGATVFVDRGRRHQVKDIQLEIKKRLQEGWSIILFAEGGASDGKTVLPFKTSFFEAAAVTGAPVVPVAIQYHDASVPSVACWYGNTFVAHILALLKNQSLEVSVVVLPEIQGEADRRVLAEKTYRSIVEKKTQICSPPVC